MAEVNKKRKELSLKEKQNILERYDKLPKMSQRCAADQLNISQPVLCRILKSRSEIEALALTNENMNRKRARSGKDSEVESALKSWFLERNGWVTGALMRQKAEELAKKMGKNNFSATDGWLNRWKKRENIVCKRGRGEMLVDEAESICAVPESCEVILSCDPEIKEEPMSEEEDEYIAHPTDEDMREALRILRRGVEDRTTDLKRHYDYERYIEELLNPKE